MPNAELIPAQLQATLGQDDGASSISADGQALLVNGGPGDTVARMHFTLPARTVHGDPWVVWVERKPVERLQLAGEGWQSRSEERRVGKGGGRPGRSQGAP